jgi:hypothetical protein
LLSRREEDCININPWRLDDVQFTYKTLSIIMAAALIATTFSVPADARVKKKKRSSVVQTQQVPSLDGRITGRPRTCGFATFQYDGWGVPYGPYCH